MPTQSPTWLIQSKEQATELIQALEKQDSGSLVAAKLIRDASTGNTTRRQLFLECGLKSVVLAILSAYNTSDGDDHDRSDALEGVVGGIVDRSSYNSHALGIVVLSIASMLLKKDLSQDEVHAVVEASLNLYATSPHAQEACLATCSTVVDTFPLPDPLAHKLMQLSVTELVRATTSSARRRSAHACHIATKLCSSGISTSTLPTLAHALEAHLDKAAPTTSHPSTSSTISISPCGPASHVDDYLIVTRGLLETAVATGNRGYHTMINTLLTKVLPCTKSININTRLLALTCFATVTPGLLELSSIDHYKAVIVPCLLSLTRRSSAQHARAAAIYLLAKLLSYAPLATACRDMDFLSMVSDILTDNSGSGSDSDNMNKGGDNSELLSATPDFLQAIFSSSHTLKPHEHSNTDEDGTRVATTAEGTSNGPQNHTFSLPVDMITQQPTTLLLCCSLMLLAQLMDLSEPTRLSVFSQGYEHAIFSHLKSSIPQLVFWSARCARMITRSVRSLNSDLIGLDVPQSMSQLLSCNNLDTRREVVAALANFARAHPKPKEMLDEELLTTLSNHLDDPDETIRQYVYCIFSNALGRFLDEKDTFNRIVNVVGLRRVFDVYSSECGSPVKLAAARVVRNIFCFADAIVDLLQESGFDPPYTTLITSLVIPLFTQEGEAICTEVMFSLGHLLRSFPTCSMNVMKRDDVMNYVLDHFLSDRTSTDMARACFLVVSNMCANLTKQNQLGTFETAYSLTDRIDSFLGCSPQMLNEEVVAQIKNIKSIIMQSNPTTNLLFTFP